MGTEVIKCEVADHIALVTMDRPPVNAVNAQFLEELMRVLAQRVPSPGRLPSGLLGRGPPR